jgi:hypothetical protein
MKKILLITLFAFCSIFSFAQNMDYTNSIITELCSDKYYGRGYVNYGDSIAASFLEKEFDRIGLKKYSKSYYQEYSTDINRIVEMPVVIFGNKELVPLKDYIVIPSSPDVDAWFKIEWLTAETLTNQWVLRHTLSSEHSNSFICIDSTNLNNDDLYKFANTIFSKNYIEAKGVIEATAHLKYTARTSLNNYISLQIKPEKIDVTADSIYVRIKNDFVKDYKTRNIIGYLPGQTDSIVMITAHYDHLGMMGNVMFPGANDNASGVAMVLNLAEYYKNQKKNKYTLVFVLFSGEEAGLLGSKYMAENPPFDLSLVKAMLNFDMIGTGDEGVFMFNAKEYPVYDTLIQDMNKNKEYFDVMKTTGATWSSDHASFFDKGVKAIFVYTDGNLNNYHQPEDVAKDLNLAAYKDIYRFVLDFIGKI